MISTSFGCPYEGEVPPDRVFEIAKQLAAFGCEEVASAIRPGWRTRGRSVSSSRPARGQLNGVELTAHFHNTRGQGLANVLAALGAGIDSFESSFGELGGCPVPPGSTGNVSTEDLVSMLEEMGVGTGVDLEQLIEASRAAQEVIGRPLGAHSDRRGAGGLAAVVSGKVSAEKLGKNVRAFGKGNRRRSPDHEPVEGRARGLANGGGGAGGLLHEPRLPAACRHTATLTDSESDKTAQIQIPAITSCPNAEATVFTVDATPGSFGGQLQRRVLLRDLQLIQPSFPERV